MQVDTQDFLRLCERAGTLACWDIESTGLKGDYNSILVLSVKVYGKKPATYQVDTVGDDKQVVLAAKTMLEAMDCWVTYYGKGFDIKMLNTRLLKWGQQPVAKRPHLDLYFALKSKLLTGRKSQGHLLNWLGTPEQKMSVSADTWSEVAAYPKKHLPELVKRCESDTKGLESLYERTKHLVVEINR